MKHRAVGLQALLLLLSSGSTAFAADLMEPYPIVDDGTLVSPFAGGYAGLAIGYSSGVVSASNHPDFTIAGFSVGGQAGYNFELGDGFVAGAQADTDWTGAKGSDNIALDANLNWRASLTGHVGYEIGAFMPYLLGGVAIGNATGTVTKGPVGTDNQTFAGWTVGAGAEVKLVSNVTGFVEYRYTDYGTKSFNIAGITTPQSYSDSAIRGGINFHF